MQASKSLRSPAVIAVAVALVAIAVLAQGVLASSPGVPVCIGSKEGKAIVTPVKGACRKGYALATLGMEGPEGKPGPEGKEGVPATRLFAEVGEKGELLHGSGVTSVVQVGNVQRVYVTFSQNVSSCVPIATPEEPAGSNDTYKKVLLAVSHHEENTIAVTMETFEAGGAPNTAAIDLAVFC